MQCAATWPYRRLLLVELRQPMTPNTTARTAAAVRLPTPSLLIALFRWKCTMRSVDAHLGGNLAIGLSFGHPAQHFGFAFAQIPLGRRTPLQQQALRQPVVRHLAQPHQGTAFEPPRLSWRPFGLSQAALA